MRGGYKPPIRLKEDMGQAVRLLNKAADAVIVDKSPKQAQKLIIQAKSICSKYIEK